MRRYYVLFVGLVVPVCLLYLYIYRHISADDTVFNAVHRKLINRQYMVAAPPGISPRPDSCKGCFQLEHKYMRTPNWKCPLQKGIQIEGREYSEEVSLIIVVLSLATNTAARNSVRLTWGTAAKNNTGKTRVVFILGNAGSETVNENIRLEAMEHQDIVQADLTEYYESLTLKTMLGLKWATQACLSARHVMKTDDDVWVNIPALLQKLNYQKPENIIRGHCYFGEYPWRVANYSKWFVSYNEFAGQLYPNYCAGVGYVMEARVAKEISDISKDVPYFKMEDVYVGLCAQTLGFAVKTMGGFCTNRKTENKCELKMNHIITAHPWNPDELMEIWNDHSHCSGLILYGYYLPPKSIYILVLVTFIFVSCLLFKRSIKHLKSIFKKR